jgi:hypothetical protein
MPHRFLKWEDEDMKKIYIAFAVSVLALSSCDHYLDKLPDNRTEINTVEKVGKLLVSAYPDRCYARMAELASDDIDDMGEGNTLMYQNAYWEDMTEADNESNNNIWQRYYAAIEAANVALEAIEDMGETDELLPYKGEALLCRAYSHLCLTMLYCLPYDPSKASQYLGIVYMDAPETTLNPEYHRETLEEDYEKINADIEEALPLIRDDIYSVPKYHFNRLAAYALATRFNLYYQKWDKVVEYASEVLGSDPSLMLRNWQEAANLEWSSSVRTLDYVDPSHRFNLLLIPLVSSNGSFFHAWSSYGARYTHNNRVCKQETFRAKRPMGGYYDQWKANTLGYVMWHQPFQWDDNVTNKVWMPKWPNQWQVVDQVKHTGISRSTLVAFTANEVLLNRAEAYVHLKQYDKAVADMDTWNESFFKVGQNQICHLTVDRIMDVYGNESSADYIAEYTSEKPTSRKALHPQGFTVEEGEQEYMFQCLLYCRRCDFLGEGLRWMDVKRFGIDIDRFDDTDYIDDTTTGYKVAATLPYNDLRRALQIPHDVISTGVEPNPRNEEEPNHPFINQ